MITVETILRPFRYKKWYCYKKSLLAFPYTTKQDTKKVLARDPGTFTFVAKIVLRLTFFTANWFKFTGQSLHL